MMMYRYKARTGDIAGLSFETTVGDPLGHNPDCLSLPRLMFNFF